MIKIEQVVVTTDANNAVENVLQFYHIIITQSMHIIYVLYMELSPLSSYTRLRIRRIVTS